MLSVQCECVIGIVIQIFTSVVASYNSALEESVTQKKLHGKPHIVLNTYLDGD